MKHYTLEKFESKFSGKLHIFCGVNYADGTHDTMMNASCSQILSYIKQTGKEVAFIATNK